MDVIAQIEETTRSARVDDKQRCRLCAGTVTDRFRGTVLKKYAVQYSECERCGSLQTEEPYWLDEAYSHNLSSLDTGAAQRNLTNLAACYSISKLFGLRHVLDIGGGDGLLCRLLRDCRINCFVKDKYARPTYAQAFTVPDFSQPEMILAFEVIEHFQNPAGELETLFGMQSDALLFSTGIYTQQQNDWWYLSPESGQHVFFYSERALNYVAKQYDYHLIISGDFVLFIKPRLLSRVRVTVAKLLLSRRACRLTKAAIMLMAPAGAWDDLTRIRAGMQ